MKANPIPAVLALMFNLAAPLAPRADPGNPNIDMEAFLRGAREAAVLRQDRRVDEAEFLRLSREKGAVILDARSPSRFAELHVAGAVNLNFSDITEESLARVLPDKHAVILIYCNNNFLNEPFAFASKLPAASLNLSTYATLHAYGYRNVHELKPLLDIHTTILPMEGASKMRLFKPEQEQ